MSNFVGEFECKLDVKGRFLLPSALKKQIDPASQDSFVVNRGFEGCLNLFPKNEWDIESKKLNKLNLYKAKERKFFRQFHNGATPLSLDSSNRLLIPKSLQVFAEIDKDIVLFAYKNRIEIWDKTKYEQVMNDDLDDLGSLAEEVMGNWNEEEDND